MAEHGSDGQTGDIVVRSRGGVRPIVSVGIFLCAACVLAIIMLAGSAFEPVRFLSPYEGRNPWIYVAILILAYCVPALASIVVVVMGDFVVPRRLRYVLAAVSWGLTCVFGVLAIQAALVETASPSSPEVHLFLEDLVSGWAWAVGLLGVMLGFSLPATAGEKDSGPMARTYPSRFRQLVVMGGLLWLLFVMRMAFAFSPFDHGMLISSIPQVFFIYVLALPGVPYFGAALIATLVWSLLTMEVPPAVSLGLRIVAWVLFLAFLIVGILIFGGALQNPDAAFVFVNITEAAPAFGAMVGILLGVGVGTMRR